MHPVCISVFWLKTNLQKYVQNWPDHLPKKATQWIIIIHANEWHANLSLVGEHFIIHKIYSNGNPIPNKILAQTNAGALNTERCLNAEQTNFSLKIKKPSHCENEFKRKFLVDLRWNELEQNTYVRNNAFLIKSTVKSIRILPFFLIIWSHWWDQNGNYYYFSYGFVWISFRILFRIWINIR